MTLPSQAQPTVDHPRRLRFELPGALAPATAGEWRTPAWTLAACVLFLMGGVLAAMQYPGLARLWPVGVVALAVAGSQVRWFYVTWLTSRHGRIVIDLTRRRLRSSFRRGVWRTSYTAPLKELRHLHVLLPPPDADVPSVPADDREADAEVGILLAFFWTKDPMNLSGTQPVAALEAIAEQLADRANIWLAGLKDAPPGHRIAWTVSQDLDAAVDSLLTPPPTSTAQVQRHDEGVTIQLPALGVMKGAQGQLSIAILLALTVIAGFTAVWLMDHLPWYWWLALLLPAAGAALAVFFVIRHARAVTVLDLSPAGLVITVRSPVHLRQHLWSVDDLVGVGVGDEDQYSRHLLIVSSRGAKHKFVAQRDLAELKWMAFLIHHELQLDAAVDESGVHAPGESDGPMPTQS